jgi:hypothetical protein
MKLNYFLLLIVGTLLLSSCASIHPGEMGESKEHGILVSAEKNSEVSDGRYTFITFTIENKEDDIFRVLGTNVSFPQSAGEKANILVGKDLATWIEAFKEEEATKKHNRRIGKIAMILGGAVLGIAGDSTGSSALETVGVGAMLGGAAWTLSDTISDSKKESDFAKKIPDTHIYAPFSVPGGKYLRRWLVIQNPKGSDITKVALKLKCAGSEEKMYVFEL